MFKEETNSEDQRLIFDTGTGKLVIQQKVSPISLDSVITDSIAKL